MAYAKVPLKKSALTLSNAEYSLCRICVHSSSAPVLSGQEDKLDIHIYFQVADRSIHHIPQILVHHMTRVLLWINSQGLGRVKLREQRQLVLHDEKNESSLLSNFHLFTSPRNTLDLTVLVSCAGCATKGIFPIPQFNAGNVSVDLTLNQMIHQHVSGDLQNKGILTAKTVDEDPASCQRWISRKEIKSAKI